MFIWFDVDHDGVGDDVVDTGDVGDDHGNDDENDVCDDADDVGDGQSGGEFDDAGFDVDIGDLGDDHVHDTAGHDDVGGVAHALAAGHGVVDCGVIDEGVADGGGDQMHHVDVDDDVGEDVGSFGHGHVSDCGVGDHFADDDFGNGADNLRCSDVCNVEHDDDDGIAEKAADLDCDHVGCNEDVCVGGVDSLGCDGGGDADIDDDVCD